MISPSRIRIIIADDHELYRDGLKLLLNKEKSFEIVGEARNGVELVALAKKKLPQIILTDIKMPLMNGIEAIKIIHAYEKDIGIIALSMYGEGDFIFSVLEAGAMGYLLKEASTKEIFEAINAVTHQEHYYSKSISTQLVAFISKHKTHISSLNYEVAHLSQKEIEIILLICKGLSAKEIGNRLFQGIRTIEGYRSVIMKKIEAKNTADIIIYAIKNRILVLDNIDFF